MGTTQGGAKVGLQVVHTENNTTVTNTRTNFEILNCKPTFAPPCAMPTRLNITFAECEEIKFIINV